MRALIVFIACLAATAPAYAFGHFGGPRPGGFPGGFRPGPRPGFPGGFRPGFPGDHHHHDHGGLGPFGGGPWPGYVPADQTAAAPFAVPVPYPIAASVCPAPIVIRAPGPHIIYIGHQPKNTGPKVIYGTE
jgi:hypothetical protein